LVTQAATIIDGDTFQLLIHSVRTTISTVGNQLHIQHESTTA